MVFSWRGYGLLTLVFWAFSFLIHLLFFGWDVDIGFTYAFMLVLSAGALWIIGGLVAQPKKTSIAPINLTTKQPP